MFSLQFDIFWKFQEQCSSTEKINCDWQPCKIQLYLAVYCNGFHALNIATINVAEGLDDATLSLILCAALKVNISKSKKDIDPNPRVSKKQRKPNLKRTRMNWDARLSTLGEEGFRKRYKLNKRSFRLLCDQLRPHLEP